MDIARSNATGWSIRQRRMFAVAATLSFLVVWFAGAQWIRISLGHPAVYSGSTLLLCLLSLMLLGLRKRLIVLPLLPVKTWVQIHIYTGVFSCAAFLVHVPSVFATGRLEGPLSWLFLVVAASGFYGLYISRTAPKRLTAVSIEPRYDRIDWHRQQIATSAQKAITDLNESADRTILETIYHKTLAPYFSSRLSLRYLVIPSSFRRRRLIRAITECHRYFDQATMQAANQLAALVRRRDDLDYQHAIQFRLRAWVTMHAGLSTVLIAWSLLHAYVAIGMLGQ